MKFVVYSCLVLVAFVTLVQASVHQQQNEAAAPAGDEQARNFRYEEEKKELGQFLNTKNMLKTIIKLLFGSTEESAATSRQVLNVVVKVSPSL